MKSTFDLVVGSLAFLALLPLMAITALAIKLDKPRPGALSASAASASTTR